MSKGEVSKTRESLYFFTGPDGYFLTQALRKRQASFGEKYGEGNCIVFTNDTITLQALQEALQGGGLFSTKKLIICKGIPDDKASGDKPSAQIVKFFEEIISKDEPSFSPDVLLVFSSIDPDKRGRLYKMLLEKANQKTFPQLQERDILAFLEKELGEYYTKDLGEYLVGYVGSDLFRLEQECSKIKNYLLYTEQKKLSEEEKQSIIYTTIEANSFGVIDAIAAGDSKKALSLIDTVATTQTAWPEFIGTLYWGLKHMLQTVDIYYRGTTSAKEIASEIGMHFFPIVKNLKYIDFLGKNKAILAKMFHKLLMLDIGIKSGAFPAEGFFSEVKMIIYESLEETK